jgi:phosphatidate phosphatase APP1
MQWSDLVREKEYQDFIDDVKQTIANATVKEVKLQMWRTTREKELNRKKFSRKRLYSETGNLI